MREYSVEDAQAAGVAHGRPHRVDRAGEPVRPGGVSTRGLHEVRALGFTPVFESSVFERRKYVAGTGGGARERVRGSLGPIPPSPGSSRSRGGYGSAQVLPWLDAEQIRAGRKVLLGCSDVTALLSYVTTRCGLIGFHGPMLVRSGGGRRRLRPGLPARPVDECVHPYGELAAGGLEVLRPGRARGPLLGGTLTQLAASLGTPFAFDAPPGFVLVAGRRRRETVSDRQNAGAAPAVRRARPAPPRGRLRGVPRVRSTGVGS